MPHSLFVNAFDELLVFGTTGSTNFPVTAGAYQTTHAGGSMVLYESASDIPFPNGSDIFVSRLSADGSQLQASTYVGGSGNACLMTSNYDFAPFYENLRSDIESADLAFLNQESLVAADEKSEPSNYPAIHSAGFSDCSSAV